ncbi:MAG TPA: TetR/AcrR family transcriptional regulator [Acidimicrobiales bacterium]|jgi:AcrR family transcriptional regulator|nr:TetR/AcrR family transcriptional regulator [Acidimicrobiales bacterium]
MGARVTARSRPETPPLTLETVVGAAVEVIEADGVGALTMRRLAARLGCSPMALYRHVATKQDLIRAIGEHYLADIALPDTDGMAWDEAIIAVVSVLHHAVLEQAALVEIVAYQHVDAAVIFRAEEAILGALRSAGLSDRDAVRGLSVITSYTVGATQRRAEQRAGSPAAVHRVQRLLQLPADAFPTLRALAGELVSVDLELSFEDGLRLLLRGIAPTRRS